MLISGFILVHNGIHSIGIYISTFHKGSGWLKPIMLCHQRLTRTPWVRLRRRIYDEAFCSDIKVFQHWYL